MCKGQFTFSVHKDVGVHYALYKRHFFGKEPNFIKSGLVPERNNDSLLCLIIYSVFVLSSGQCNLADHLKFHVAFVEPIKCFRVVVQFFLP